MVNSLIKDLLIFAWLNLLIASTFAIDRCNDNSGNNYSCGFTTSQPSIYVDFILDEYITDNNPLLKSLIYAANSNSLSKVIISYQNPNALELATRLNTILAKHNIASMIKYTYFANTKISKLISLTLYN